MSKNPLISIVVPLYNKEKTINRCIDSVFSQTYDSWELIIVDDGSTDKSSYIIENYLNDERVRYIKKSNGGVSETRNVGIKAAIGQWVIFIDADDYFLPNALDLLLKNALKYKTVVSTANFYMERGLERFRVCVGWKNKLISNNFKAMYFSYMVVRAGSTLYESDFLKNHLFDETLSRYEDSKMAFSVLRDCKIAYSNSPIMCYTLDNLGLSKKARLINRDFTFNLNFQGKSFWEKMLISNILNDGFRLYPEHKAQLKSMYKDYLKYARLDLKFRLFNYYYRKYAALVLKTRIFIGKCLVFFLKTKGENV